MGFEGGAVGKLGLGENAESAFSAVNPVGGAFMEGERGQKTTSKSDISSGSKSGITLAPESSLERLATEDISGQYGILRDLLNRGPGAAEIDASNASQKDFISMMRSIAANGGMPTDEDRRQANIFADDLFKPQMEALNQSFTQQNEGAARLAAQLNRPINDPIIQAKLRQEQMRQSAMLSADRSAFTAQEARNSPFRRLELQGQLADAQGALASQAMANRMQLLNLGNALQSQERNWRLQTGTRWGTQTQSGTSTQHSGGGMMGGLGASMGVIGSGLSLFGSAMSYGMMPSNSSVQGYNQQAPQGGGGGGAAMPALSPSMASGPSNYNTPYYLASPQSQPNRGSRIFNPSAGGSSYWNFGGR